MQKPHEDLQPLSGHAEPLPAGLDLGPDLFRIKPADFIDLTFLQGQRIDIHRLPVDIDPGDLVIPERFAVKDLFVLDAEFPGKSQLSGGCRDPQFLFKFPQG